MAVLETIQARTSPSWIFHFDDFISMIRIWQESGWKNKN